jgi:hypothetical protein
MQQFFKDRKTDAFQAGAQAQLENPLGPLNAPLPAGLTRYILIKRVFLPPVNISQYATASVRLKAH